MTASTILRKREELLLAARERLYELYGELITVWRLWNSVFAESSSMDESRKSTLRRELLERATTAAGRAEAIVLKLTSELELDDEALDAIGKFRQAFSSVRESIRDDEKVNWGSSESPEYVAIKLGASHVSELIAASNPARRIPVERAVLQLRVVTSNYFEHRWQDPRFDRHALKELIASIGKSL